MELLLLYVALAVVVSLYAARRGRRLGVWLAIAIVTSPLIAWLALLALPRAAGTNDAEPTTDTHVRCPDCRELVRRDARRCKHCGIPLIPQ